ncbi:aminotransferase class V-fold PLP-dependent enzyme [Paralimibaculum aggregatum]|uniref:Aminotransferase class V-fold PLP-dependent enzyme n=1 Tax=Paralimibaculum aggregatum TaxID=3036245 RepID=A0ABQ6LLA7_9RHOB|nr:aminotransferase class V-fold PLP-dependent enzyme [Limibaculum sp. NKW23]GMG81070.1 aminotransferase class V-fold PLP-dependent enzyme [Limibaculum sp. NKW23]
MTATADTDITDTAAAAPALDIAHVRAAFPALAEPTLAGWAFFENAGGSYPCRQVLRRLTEFYTRTKVQPYAPYPAARRAGAWMDEAVERLAPWLGVAPDWLHVGPSTSQNTYVLAQAFRRHLRGRAGAEIVVTEQDHEANSGVWRRLAEEGITIREWQVDPGTGRLDPAALDALLSERTALVAFPHCSNIVGAINPVAEITAKVRAAGAVSVVDGVSYAPHGLPDVAALGADVYLFSAYKTYGPHQGVMVADPALVDRLPCEGHGFNAGYRAKRLTPAGPDHAQVAALAGIADYFDDLHSHHFASNAAADGRAARVRGLMRGAEIARAAPLLAYLEGRNDLRVLGPTDPAGRAPTVSIAHARPGEALAAALAEHRIMAGGGDFYAPRVIRAMGEDPEHGVLRLSFVHYTSAEEIDRLIAALDRVL